MLSSRFYRRSALLLLCMMSGVCAAQPGKPQFVLPKVEPTFGQVASFLVGPLQEPNALSTDFFYVNAPVVSAGTSAVTVGELLSNQAGGFNNLLQNQLTFPNVSSVVAALADFDGDHVTDYIFALTPTVAGAPNLCIYYGSGGGFVGSAYSGPGPPPSHYPPSGGKSGCMTFPVTGSQPPNFAYIATPSFKTNLVPELMIEDGANNLVYIFSNSGGSGFGGGLPNISLNSTLAIPAVDGAGPIYVADLNHDQNTDIVINGQTGYSALVYLGNGDGTFQAPVRYTFDHHVHSMLLQDMDGDGILDMVVEGDNGVIEIFKGKGDGTFGNTSIGGTAAGLDGLSGNGGHLAAIGALGKDITPHIFTTTPIGLSVLQQTPAGTLNYTLSGIYNIGPGRSSFALADFNGDSYNDLAVDSPEGVAIALGDALGGSFFQTSLAYTTLAPALGSVVGKFRTSGNPNGNLDVAVNTGTFQGQLLTGNGNGTFTTYPGTLVPIGLSVSPNVWSNILSGDFNGDGIPDIAYSLTGLPATSVISVLIQYGNGNGTFAAPAGINPILTGLPLSNTLFGESAVGDFNGDGIADIANADAANDDTLLGQRSGAFTLGLNQPATNSNFSQVAAGFFKLNRTSKQDLIFQQGASLIPYLNSGTGKQFTAMPALAGTPSPSLLVAAAVLLADLDNDGKGDVVAVYYNPNPNPVGAGPVAPNQLYIWYGNGDGTFGQPQITTLTRNDYLAAVGDLNHDGLPDILLADGSLVTALYNQGARIFGGEQHFLAGQGVNSLSVADVNGDGQADLIVANGGATLSNPLALGGATKPSVSLPANPDVNTGGITVLVNNIQTQPVTGTLVATPEPSALAATFNLTATITPSAGVAPPTGFVSFSIDGTPVGSGAPVPVTTVAGISSASVVIPAGNSYATGIHTLTAFYTGDANNSSLPLNGTHAIGAGLTTTQLLLCVGPTPTCPAPPGVTNPAPPYSANLTMAYGQIWNGILNAFANDGSVLTGTVSINDLYNGALLPAICTLPVGGGQCPTSTGTTLGTGVGVNVLTAVYSGDATHLSSTSLPVTITVVQGTTTATITGAPNPSPQGHPVTFTATFTGNFAAPTGTVQFSEQFPPTATVQLLGQVTLVPGTGLTSTATFTTSSLPIGVDTIQATFAGTPNFLASSATTTETITAPLAGNFTLSVSPSAVTVGVGYVTAFTVKVTPVNGFAQSVNLACGTMPHETTCTILNAAIPVGGGSTTLFVGTTAPHSCGTTTPYFLGSNGVGPHTAPFALPALAGLLAIFIPGKRRSLRALVAILAVAAATQITGCGNCTDLGTLPASYTFTVSGSSNGTPEVESQTVTINVTI